jgi:hypothetical protein
VIGHQLALEAESHRVRLGLPLQELRVLRDGAGYLVVPVGTAVVPLLISVGGSSDLAEYAPVAAPATVEEDGESTGLLGTLSQGWAQVYANCYARITDTWSWMDHCARIFKLSNDSDAQRDYYALQHYATAAANWPWRLWWGKISSSPVVTGSYGAQSWVDWSPKSDYSGNCRPVGLSVSALGFGLGFSTEQCESYHFTKDNPAVNYSLQGTWFVGSNVNRELAYEIAVSVAQGKGAAWTVPAEVHGGM